MHPRSISDHPSMSLVYQHSQFIEPSPRHVHQNSKNACYTDSQHHHEHHHEQQQTIQRPKVKKMKSEPIRFELKRSDSEQQLDESEQAAEHRDYCMYCRIVRGMARDSPRRTADPSLVNIIRTRHAYSNSSASDSTINYNHGAYQNQHASTPVLCNHDPGSKAVGLTFAPRLPFGYNSATAQHVPCRLPMIPASTGMVPNYQSDDDIFDLEM